jgi:hypothetical protein
MVVPLHRVEDIRVCGPLWGGLGAGSWRAIKLDWADVCEHVALDKSSGWFRTVHFSPPDPAGFVAAVEAALAAREPAGGGVADAESPLRRSRRELPPHRSTADDDASDRRSMTRLARVRRPLAIVTAIVFCISSVFPAVGAFVHDRESWPQWWGVLDVVLAFVLAVLAMAVLAIAQGKVTKQAEEASYRAYRILTHGILAGLLVCYLDYSTGGRIVWSNCLTGFAWRAWLLLYCLPAWFTTFGGRQDVRAEPVAAAARPRD